LLVYGEQKSFEKSLKSSKRLEVIDLDKRKMIYFFTPSNKIRSLGYASDSSFFAYLTKEGISVCRKKDKHSPTFY